MAALGWPNMATWTMSKSTIIQIHFTRRQLHWFVHVCLLLEAAIFWQKCGCYIYWVCRCTAERLRCRNVEISMEVLILKMCSFSHRLNWWVLEFVVTHMNPSWPQNLLSRKDKLIKTQKAYILHGLLPFSWPIVKICDWPCLMSFLMSSSRSSIRLFIWAVSFFCLLR